MRGKLQAIVNALPQIRITPAGAGKTNVCNDTRRRAQDHPRRCGENNFTFADLSPREGSPPQVRGKRGNLIIPVRRDRITPAGAGKTSVSAVRENLSEDHPRRCGENTRRGGYIFGLSGSPPQVRGKPADMAASPQVTRITPAGAGKTRGHTAGLWIKKDHPRRCGENRLKKCALRRVSGSPPQVRGKH